MSDEKNQLAGDIARYFANPDPAPTLPKVAAPNAPLAEREAYLASVRDAETHAILSRSTGEATREDRDRLHAEILACMKREGLG
jgi:hypothetical protein